MRRRDAAPVLRTDRPARRPGIAGCAQGGYLDRKEAGEGA